MVWYMGRVFVFAYQFQIVPATFLKSTLLFTTITIFVCQSRHKTLPLAFLWFLSKKGIPEDKMLETQNRGWVKKKKKKVVTHHSVLTDPLRPYELQPVKTHCLWASPAKNTQWVAIPFSRGSSQPRDKNPGLLHCRWILFFSFFF